MTIQKQLQWHAINKLSTKLSPPVGLYAHSNNSQYHFMMTNKIKYAVKYDPLTYKTNRVFIQKRGFFTYSGLDHTIAHFYVIVVDKGEPSNNAVIKNYDFYLIAVNKINDLIKKNLYSSYYKYCINSGYVFELDVIKKYSALL
jgi:hypothetical protein